MSKAKLKDETGITLVELLAVLVLMSLVIALGGAIHIFGQKQFRAQTESASQNNDYSYAMTLMSSDLRKVPLSEVASGITLNDDPQVIKIEGGPIYSYTGNQLTRNNEVIIDNLRAKPIIQFGYIGDETSAIDRIEIKLKQINNEAGLNNKDYQTTIYFRGEPNNAN